MNKDYDGGYNVNFNEILKADDVPEIVKSLARGLMVNPYTKVGDYLQSLNYEKLDELNEILDTDDEDYRIGNLMLMTLMLAQAEGVHLANDAMITEALGIFQTYIAITGLQRKGMIRAYYENMSFGDDMKDKRIAEKI